MDYIEALRRRVALSEMSDLCTELGIPRQRSWANLRSSLIAEIESAPERAEVVIRALTAQFKSSLTCRDRAVVLFRPGEERLRAIESALRSIPIEPSAFLSSYPLPVEDELLVMQDDSLVLCSREIAGSVTTLIFCGKRQIEERVGRQADQVDPEALRRMGWTGYDEFVLVKRKYIQIYEVLRLDSQTGLVEILVEEHAGVKPSESTQHLQNAVEMLLQSRSVNGLGVPVNLFPSIRALYDSTEGIVVELGFTTRTGSSKNEKMRAHRNDLRSETFHVGGKAAIHGLLTPFRIAIRWQDGEASAMELFLPGNMRQLSKTPPTLDHCVLTGTTTEARVRACITRLVQYLPHVSPPNA